MKRILSSLLILAGLAATACSATVRTGLDNLDRHEDLFRGKRVGIITNHTARDSKGRHVIDIFVEMEGVRITALFGPEHGIYGLAEAGEKVAGGVDPVHGIPVHSLYGKTRKPTAEMLAEVDVLVFDIQDIGARFYTYIYTMALAMEAAAESGKEFVVLDRPNPINGKTVAGPILESGYASFVGKYPIPVRHGMTVAELARMFNHRGWLVADSRVNLHVVCMTGWKRNMWFDQTGLEFIKPSPNMPDLATATAYPGLCLLEGTNVSEGRGTDRPFLQFGAPWIDSDVLAKRLNGLGLEGVLFEKAGFVPTFSKHKDRHCEGAKLIITNRDRFALFCAGVLIVNELYKLDRNEFEWRIGHFDRLCGTSSIRKAILAGESLNGLIERWSAEANQFAKDRGKYLLYRE